MGPIVSQTMRYNSTSLRAPLPVVHSSFLSHTSMATIPAIPAQPTVVEVGVNRFACSRGVWLLGSVLQLLLSPCFCIIHHMPPFCSLLRPAAPLARQAHHGINMPSSLSLHSSTFRFTFLYILLSSASRLPCSPFPRVFARRCRLSRGARHPAARLCRLRAFLSRPCRKIGSRCTRASRPRSPSHRSSHRAAMASGSKRLTMLVKASGVTSSP
jgi:hypothetical protein